MKLVFQRLYFFLWGLPVFVVCMVTFTPLILLSLAVVPNRVRGGKIAYFWLRCWGWWFSTATFVFYKTYSNSKIKKDQAYVFASNHNSFIDGINICLAIPNDFRPLGKIELTKVPVFGWMYRYVVILVDRKSAESRLRSMREMEDHLKQNISVLVFPEGTMNSTPQLLQEFKNGAFTLAIDTQTPIVPMVMVGTRKILPKKPPVAFQPGLVKTFLLDPIETKGLQRSDLESLKTKVYHAIYTKLLEFEPR